jgi:hypothetical protein
LSRKKALVKEYRLTIQNNFQSVAFAATFKIPFIAG